ncbi:MAG TPA: PHB depolymerase family esterase [Polyangiaceae bacterium]|nr:PHB depolymerase family esterase [Polyangiaceae bacterium]
MIKHRRSDTALLCATLLATSVAACSSGTSSSGTPSGTGGASGGPATTTGGTPGVATGGTPGSGGATPGGGGTVTGGGATPGNGGTVMGLSGAPTTGTGGTAPGAGGAGAGGVSATTGGTTGSSGAGGGSAGSGAGGAGGGGAVTCPATSTLPMGETTQSIMVGGVSRSYILHVPAKYTGTSPTPLVVDWHPILATAQFERGNSGYAALSDSEGFIVAYPQGIDNAWNIGPCCTMSRTVDDLGFAKALVDKLKSQGCIDPKRVYAAGYSMGGGMSHYLGCNAADVFATVTPAAFDLLEEDEEPCHPSRPITVMSFRGTADPIVPYAGGASNPPNGLAVTIHFLGAVATFQKWAMLDSCTDASPTMGANGCQTYSKCNAGVEVTLCTAQGGGHVTGDATQEWAMMKKHPMP